MTKNDPKWPKMTQNGQKWPKNDPKCSEMAKNDPKWQSPDDPARLLATVGRLKPSLSKRYKK